MTVRITAQVRIDATHHVLCRVAQRYYLGCKAYHLLAGTNSPDRARWHARLKTLAQVGNHLADALLVPRPNWPVLYHVAGRYRHSIVDPFGHQEVRS